MVFSALIEGLAGVVDRGQLFREVEISPQWIAAGKTDVTVNVTYGPSSKLVNYHFQHNAASKTIRLSLSGDPERYTVRIPLPSGRTDAKVKVDQQLVKTSIQKMENSHYVVIKDVIGGKHEIIVAY